MKKLTLHILFLIIALNVVKAQDSIIIQGVKYKSDTLIHTHDVGLGTMHTYYRLPELPLLVNTLVVDATNPHIRFETCLGRDSLIGLERPSAMATRNSRTGHQVFAAINGDFYNTVSPNQGDPVNGQMLAGLVAKKPHTSRPVIAFDNGNNPFLDLMTFSGTIKKDDQTYTISNVNSTRNTDNLILFNAYFGTNTRTNQWGTEVVLTLKEGNWGVNRKMKLEVIQVLTGQGSTPIPKGKIVLSGHGKAATFLNGFQAGNEIEAEIRIRLNNFPALSPGLLELIGGDRIILKDGIVQENNWPELHPRTTIGYSSDGSKIIMAVVDGRTDNSKGVSTKQLADIMKASGAAHALNLDGGGSSVMVVRNKIKNSPSDGSERAVGNALLIVSTALPGAEKSMQLNARHITIPFGKKFQVLGSTFDEAGEIIKYLTAGNIHFSLSGMIGKIDQNGLFTASGTGEKGWITGTWNGISDTISVTVKPVGKIAFPVKSLVIDDRRDYTFKVYGTSVEGDKYLIDNDIIAFHSLDKTIGTVDGDGKFRGLRDGRTGITVATGRPGQTDTCWVKVEVGRGTLLLDDFSEPGTWSTSLSYIDNINLSRAIHPVYNTEMLKVDYSLTFSDRTASITMNKTIGIYGMPDSLMLEATGTGYRSSFYYLLDHTAGLCQVPAFTGTSLLPFPAPVRVAEIRQEDYPVPLKSIRLIVEKDPAYVSGSKYSGTFWLKSIHAIYPAKDPQYSSVNPRNADDLIMYPNPARQGFFLQTSRNMPGLTQLSMYNIAGHLVWNDEVMLQGGNIPNYISVKDLPPGFYVLEVIGRDRFMRSKIVLSR